MWQEINGEYLLTNDFGFHIWLKRRDFTNLLAGKISERHPSFPELASKGFLHSRLDLDEMCSCWREKNAHLFSAPILHIFVLTTRCNHACLYCQSGYGGVDAASPDMDLDTARKFVDFSFRSPSRVIIIEFQGGEPLLNWKTLKGVTEYAGRKAKAAKKVLHLTVVSNLSLMTREKADFLLKHGISLCTSLDGPAVLHNSNRVYSGGDSHSEAVKWLTYFRKASEKNGSADQRPSALLTVTRKSLSCPHEIVDEYVRQGLKSIFIRPLSPMGRANENWADIGYSAAEFSDFYSECMAYIISLNRKGTELREKTACIMLEKILNSRDAGYLDSRCPCGAAIGQMAYTASGDIYTCDEGRMVGRSGDQLFRMGNVFKDSYAQAISSPAARGCVVASNLESQHACARCAYKPYCGVCPVCNYQEQGSPWGNMVTNERCAQSKGMFKTIFTLLREPKSAEILKRWVAAS